VNKHTVHNTEERGLQSPKRLEPLEYSDARKISERQMDVEQLRDSSIANLKSVFSRTLRVQDIAGELIGAFIDILLNGPIPDGLRNPMASGAKRGVASRRNVETLLANIVTLLASKKKTLAISLNRNT